MKKMGANKSVQVGDREGVMVSVGVFAYIVGLLFRIPLMKVLGENGMGYFAPVNEILMLATLFITGGMAETVHSQVKYRMKREQYKGAQRIFRCACFLTLIFGLLACTFLILFNDFVSNTVLLERYSKWAVCMMAPVIVFVSLTGILRGYFQGSGSRIPTIHSVLLEKVLVISLGVLGAILFQRHGEKVADLLRTEDFASSYGAIGAFAGIFLASVLSFLHLLFIYLLYSGTVRRQMYKDNSRTMESSSYLYSSLLVSCLPYGIFAAVFQLNTLVDQRIYYYFMNIYSLNHENVEVHNAEVWGNYYGIYMVVIGVLAAAGCLIFRKAVTSVAVTWNRDENRLAKDLMTRAVNACIMITIPMAILTAVLAEPLADIFTQGDPAKTAGMIRWGSPLIIFIALGYFWIGLLKQFKKTVYLLAIVGGGFLLHLGAIYLLLSRTEMGINGVAFSNVVWAIGIFVSGMFVISQMMQYRKEWIQRCGRTLVVTILCAAIAGLIAMLLNMAVVSLVGEILSILICLVITIPIYFIIMILLRGLSESDLENMPAGAFLVRIARSLHLL